MIVPEIAGSAASELDELRVACDTAIGRLLSVEPDTIVIVGGGPTNRSFGPGGYDSFARFGAPLMVRLGRETPTGESHSLPLSVLVGGWLLGRAAVSRVVARSVSDSSSVADCLAAGRNVITGPDRVALLVMGDGSACRGEKSPGYDDPRAAAYDDGVAEALASADTDALLGLDPKLSTELRVAGRAPWQVLAGATQATGVDWRADLTYYAAPYGVAYFVASWELAV